MLLDVIVDFRSANQFLRYRDARNTICREYVLPDFCRVFRGYMREPSRSGKLAQGEDAPQAIVVNRERFTLTEILFQLVVIVFRMSHSSNYRSSFQTFTYWSKADWSSGGSSGVTFAMSYGSSCCVSSKYIPSRRMHTVSRISRTLVRFFAYNFYYSFFCLWARLLVATYSIKRHEAYSLYSFGTISDSACYLRSTWLVSLGHEIVINARYSPLNVCCFGVLDLSGLR